MNDLVIKEIKYYVENNVTKSDVAKYFNRSLSSVKKDFAKFKKYVEENPECEYYELYLQVLAKAKSNEQLGKVRGGKSTNSGKKSLLTLNETLEVARYIVQNGITLREAEQELNISRSTIYDSIEKMKDSSDEVVKQIYNDIHMNYFSNKSNAVYNIVEGINESNEPKNINGNVK